jgi:hypothetical protein
MTQGADLLKALGGSVRPAGVPGGAPISQAFSRVGFATMLEQARAGQISSGVPVSVLPSAGVELTPSQMQRLAIAADQAEAQGAARAVVAIDGMLLHLDVGVRSITGRIDAETSGVLAGVDAVVVAPPEQEGAPAGVLPPPSANTQVGAAWRSRIDEAREAA